MRTGATGTLELPEGAAKRARVRAMFDRIAPRYDRVNRLISLGLDQRWRRLALAAAQVGSGDRVIDLACGTGDLAEAAAARGARVVGVDFAREMLAGAARRGLDREGTRLVQADAAALPLASASADALVCGFALRNFVALPAVFAEMARVLRPGGRIALLDADRPRSAWLRAGHSLYFDRFVPWLGARLSDAEAYRYLPESTAYLPPPGELLAQLAKAGFAAPARHGLMLGSVQLITGMRR